MRKIKILIATACFMVLFCLFANAVQADVQIDSTQAQAGDTVYISVSLAQSLDIKSMYFAVDCENKELLPSAAKWQFSAAVLKEWDTNAADGVVAFSALKNAAGEILQLTVDIPADTAEGDYVLSGVCTMQNEKGKTVSLQVADGNISVVAQSTELQGEAVTATDHSFVVTEQASTVAMTASDTATSMTVSPTNISDTTEQTAAGTMGTNAVPDVDLQAEVSIDISQADSANDMQATAANSSAADATVEQENDRQVNADAKQRNDSGQKKIMMGVALSVLLCVATAFVMMQSKKKK